MQSNGFACENFIPAYNILWSCPLPLPFLSSPPPSLPCSLITPFFFHSALSDSTYERKHNNCPSEIGFFHLIDLQLDLFSWTWHYLILFMDEKYSVVYTYHIFFIYASVFGYLGWFHNLTIVNSSIVNIGVQVCLQ
jgi:hypothetical protein